ncbi:Peptidase family M23 [Streptomyces sp. DvalAA-14]|uniref:peptidoglycan DD-metalloendopeptidase family protein n=1 Tax=unclassified Streptomyces TaxID=2593676 RepID=UPI00081B06F1|nr:MULTISPECIES: peptidoglycan DD-metalloendopeptidase family protein [unclassified Streptomyces]MYS22047.1 peptidoglycan DD-metalloendopeptidase family protein [Streptomyces sp. SID4948]SCE07462.1 Peptidase family M23 [Streptomyces sp. DvalAA-14]
MTLTTICLTLLTTALLTAAPALGADPGPTRTPTPARSAAGPGAGPGCTAARCWPVAGPGAGGRPLVLRAFDPPATPWAAGHRGVDLRAGPGAVVRAAAAGRVAFSGEVGGTPVVVVELPGGLRTTYEPVRGSVSVGAAVPAGGPVGVLAGRLPHCPGSCLHWGLLCGDIYLDPLTLLPPSLRRSEPSRLLPLGRARSAGA